MLVSVVLIALLFIFAGCKKKEVEVKAEAPPPKPKQTEQEFLKKQIDKIDQLMQAELGYELPIAVEEGVTTTETGFLVSLFKEEFIAPAEQPYVSKYLFPSVVYRLGGIQLEVPNNAEVYAECVLPGEVIWILKQSPDPKKQFPQIPILLVWNKTKTKFWVLDQNGDEMSLRIPPWNLTLYLKN